MAAGKKRNHSVAQRRVTAALGDERDLYQQRLPREGARDER